MSVAYGRLPIGNRSSVVSAPNYDEWARVRTEFGLDSDPSYLSQIASDPTTTSTSLGIPLTAAESANIEGRDSLNPISGRIQAAGETSPYFGGVKIDQASGGTIDIEMVGTTNATSASQAFQAQLLALIPPGISAEISTVTYSYKTLQTAYNVVGGDFAAHDLDGWQVATVSQVGEQLIIGLPANAPDSAVTDLKNRYAYPFLSVQRGATVDFQLDDGRDHTSGPLYGGEWITSETGTHTTHPNCTAGYGHATGTQGGSYEITAGHCDAPGARWHQGLDPDKGYSDYGNYFGTATNNNGAYTGTTSKCDCQSIPIPASANTPQVYITNTDKYTYTGLPTNTNTSGGYGIGRRVCDSGAAWADDHGGGIPPCGVIEGQNFMEETPAGVIVTNLIQSSISGNEEGDSGAPVGDGGDFMGIHSGVMTSSPYYEIFSRSVYIASVTGATPTF